MALDHALALAATPGRGALRFYRWLRPTLSLGRHEPARRLWDPARLQAAGVDVVRRPTGGRAVLHHRELTYAVAVPASGPGSMRALYRAVNRGLVRGLRALGVPASRAAARGRASGPGAGPCFERPAEGEVVIGERKLVGSAQVRLDGHLLQHGSILLADDQLRLRELARIREGNGDRGVTSLEAWLHPLPQAEELAAVLGAALSAELGGDWHRADPEPTLDPSLLARLEAHYRSPEWTWRR